MTEKLLQDKHSTLCAVLKQWECFQQPFQVVDLHKNVKYMYLGLFRVIPMRSCVDTLYTCINTRSTFTRSRIPYCKIGFVRVSMLWRIGLSQSDMFLTTAGNHCLCCWWQPNPLNTHSLWLDCYLMPSSLSSWYLHKAIIYTMYWCNRILLSFSLFSQTTVVNCLLNSSNSFTQFDNNSIINSTTSEY